MQRLRLPALSYNERRPAAEPRLNFWGVTIVKKNVHRFHRKQKHLVLHRRRILFMGHNSRVQHRLALEGINEAVSVEESGDQDRTTQD